MKIFVLILFCLLSVNQVFAKDYEVCENESDIAEAIMESRQNNDDIVLIFYRLEKSFAELQDEYPSKDFTKDLERYRQMIKIAYSEIRFLTNENKVNAIRDFKNEIFLKCIGG